MAVPTKHEDSPDGLHLLAIGDVHLGTRPARLVGSGAGVDPTRLTPEAALSAAVDTAIDGKVDAVLFAGDVVESTNARFEALRPLEAAVRRLSEAGIAVLAVVGNHDVEALPRLASRIDGLEILGEGGRWSSRTIEAPGGAAAVEVIGWSFPARQVRASPLADLLRHPLPRAQPGAVRIGLLHGDLDASGGVYAPFTREEARRTGLDAWLLGHVHRPSLPRGSARTPPCGYLGSLVGLDPGEPGPHGPWLVRVSRSGGIALEHLASAPLRWEHIDLRVAEDDTAEDVGDRLLDRMDAEVRRLAGEGPAPEVLGLRVRLTGSTRHQDALCRKIDDGAWSSATRSVGGTFVFIESIRDRLAPAVDLEALASDSDPPALLARKLLVLDRPGEDRRRLLEAARAQLRNVATDSRWSPAGELRDATDPLSDDALLALLRRSGRRALAALLAQKTPATRAAKGTAS